MLYTCKVLGSEATEEYEQPKKCWTD